MPFRILVADDHEVVRRGLCALLASHSGWEVCGEAEDGRVAVEKIPVLKPDIVILDVGMPNLNGLEAARQILRKDSYIKILILTLHASRQVLEEALHTGAHGFLLKSDAARDLVAAVEALQQGKNYFSPALAGIGLDDDSLRADPKPAPDPLSFSRLTSREREIVQLLAEGKTCREVAQALGLSLKTAETHRGNIMRKLNIHSVVDLVLFAIRSNVVFVSNRQS